LFAIIGFASRTRREHHDLPKTTPKVPGKPTCLKSLTEE
jgi:hypothetical protein